MPTLDEQAEYCRLGLELHVLSAEDVIAWADRHIAELESPDSRVIHLALMVDAHAMELAEYLERHFPIVDEFVTVRPLLGRMQGVLSEESERGAEFARQLRRFYTGHNHDVPEEFQPMSRFDDQIDLAESGTYWDPNEIRVEFVEWLRTFVEN